MAIVTILIGSMFGLLAGVVGVSFFGMTFGSAFALYLTSGIATGILTTGFFAATYALSARSQATAA